MIIVLGEILIDVFDKYTRIGGAPFNFAFHLKKLGWPVRFLTRVGDDAYGQTICDLLQTHDFSLDDVQLDPNHPTGTVQIHLDDQGIPEFDIHTEVAYDYFDATAFKPIQWPDVKMIYIGSLAQRTNNNFISIQTLIQKRRSKTSLFFDINLRPPHVNTAAIEASLEQTDILKLNDDELSIIHNLYNGPISEDQQISWIMERFEIKTAILTKGSHGSIMTTKNKTVQEPVHKNNQIVDTVGAGDAYGAVSAAGYLKNLPPETIVEKASEFAAYVCTLPGAIPEDTSIYEPMRPLMGGSNHG